MLNYHTLHTLVRNCFLTIEDTSKQTCPIMYSCRVIMYLHIFIKIFKGINYMIKNITITLLFFYCFVFTCITHSAINIDNSEMSKANVAINYSKRVRERLVNNT